MSTSNDFRELLPEELRDLFPESMLTIKDKIPQNQLLFYTCLTIMKAMMNVNYSEEQIHELVKFEIGCIPDAQRDEQFMEELNKAYYIVVVDIRPEFCMTKASVEYCARKKIPAFVRELRPDIYKLNHAVFNLLCRRGMLSKIQMKQMLESMPRLPEEK
jgi:hypothetical protein